MKTCSILGIQNIGPRPFGVLTVQSTCKLYRNIVARAPIPTTHIGGHQNQSS